MNGFEAYFDLDISDNIIAVYDVFNGDFSQLKWALEDRLNRMDPYYVKEIVIKESSAKRMTKQAKSRIYM